MGTHQALSELLIKNENFRKYAKMGTHQSQNEQDLRVPMRPTSEIREANFLSFYLILKTIKGRGVSESLRLKKWTPAWGFTHKNREIKGGNRQKANICYFYIL